MSDNIENNNNISDLGNTNNTTSWFSDLPQELKSSPSLTKFKDTASLAQSYLEAEKALGSRVTIPTDDSPSEEWSKFYTRLGLPEDKKYLDQRSEEDEEYISAYEDMFYNSGLSKKQGKQILESMYKYSNDLRTKQEQASQQEISKTREENTNWLKQTYGSDFDGKMSLMQASLSKFGSTELAALIEDSDYNPALIDLLVKVGSTLKSDSLITGDKIAPISDKDSALSEIKKLESDEHFMVKLKDKNNTAHNEAVKKMEELYNLAYNS